MKRLVILVAVFALIGFGTPVFATSPGNSHSNTKGKGHTNHKGNGFGHHKGEKQKKVKKTKKVKKVNKNKNTNNNTNSNVNRNKNTNTNTAKATANANNRNSNTQGQLQGQKQNANNTQSQSASNEGVSNETNVSSPVSVDASDNSIYEEARIPPNVAPVFGQRGQNGFTFNTPFGGAGYQRDTKDSKLLDTGAFIQQSRDANLLDEEDAKKATLSIANKLLKRSCGKDCMIDVEEVEEPKDDKITGNGGNL